MNYRMLLESYRNHARANHDSEMVQFADLFIEYERTENDTIAEKLTRHPRGDEAADWIAAEIYRVKHNIARRDAALLYLAMTKIEVLLAAIAERIDLRDYPCYTKLFERQPEPEHAD